MHAPYVSVLFKELNIVLPPSDAGIGYWECGKPDRDYGLQKLMHRPCMARAFSYLLLIVRRET
jgi:hypothetical protein